jgi:lipoprotein NlpD
MPAKLTFVLFLGSLLLAACGGDRPVIPVSDRTRAARQPESETRTVLHGDTLYSIAWEAGRDYHELAAWNGLAPPYTIVPGQQLRLYPPPHTPAPQVAAASTPMADKKAVVPLPAKPKPPAKKSVKRAPPTKVAAKPAKSVTPAVVAKPAKPGRPVSSARSSSVSGPSPASSPGLGWTWPSSGKILKNFDENGAVKGLDIGGSRGQPVQAAADGRVVYQGSGLRGYGQLIILKHNDEFLSAYAHNDRIYLKEGDAVKRGQKIAAMGNSGTDQVMLHFEIRRNGKPVDPLKYLPKR